MHEFEHLSSPLYRVLLRVHALMERRQRVIDRGVARWRNERMLSSLYAELALLSAQNAAFARQDHLLPFEEGGYAE